MRFVIDDIKKSFDSKEVIKGASFTFERGKIYGLLGRNGSGKTTLFNCINEDLIVDSGNVYIEKDGKQSHLEGDDVGYVLSTPSVPTFLTAREFLKFFVDINKDKIDNPKNIDEYFDMISILEEDRDRLLKDYSLGMKNKMQMLVNFIANPSVLLLDEPLTSFDVVVAEEMKRLLVAQKKDNIIIFSTHIMELAMELCDEIVILSGGTLTGVEKDKNVIIETLRRNGDE